MSNDSDGRTHYLGERLSLKGHSCTIRWIGQVADKPGTWLGVEWDEPDRGKHNGRHAGVNYFRCVSRAPKCASFLRPIQPWDAQRTFLQALREKYMPEFLPTDVEVVYFNGKQAEEIGFEKFHQRQAQLQGIHVLVLDHMRVQHRHPAAVDEAEIAQICADITELDLSGNLFETFDEICALCKLFPKLRVLTLTCNRFLMDQPPPRLLESRIESVRTLSLANTFVDDLVIDVLLGLIFPSVTRLSLVGNEYERPPNFRLPSRISVLDLSDNDFVYLNDATVVSEGLHTLILKRNNISSVLTIPQNTVHLAIQELDLSYNKISTFTFFDTITTSNSFPALKHLRVTGNPLYRYLLSADHKPLTPEDGYMLTIARLPRLEYLNYSKITEKERLNSETYYLGQIAIELASVLEEHKEGVISQHPRYRDLCEEYGEPNIQRKPKKDAVDPNTLAARLVSVTFTLANGVFWSGDEQSWTDELPKSLSIYAILGLVGKRLKTMPLALRLVFETNERDPVASREVRGGPEWWDSSDEEQPDGDEEWVKREVALVAGTRALATYLEGDAATIRVEMRRGNGMLKTLIIRNLTSEHFTLTLVERFDNHDNRIKSLAGNFTGLLRCIVPGTSGKKAVGISASATPASHDEVDIELEPFRTNITQIPTDPSQTIRLTFRGDGNGRWRVDVPTLSDATTPLVPLSTGQGDEFTAIYNDDTTVLTLLDSTDLSSWMHAFPDTTPLSALSLPGTHNSPTCYPALPSVRCQAVSITKQLENGVRFLDVRVQINDVDNGVNSDSMELVHSAFPISFLGSVKMKTLVEEVYDFLDKHPEEAIIMSLKREGRGSGTDAILSDRLLKYYTSAQPQRWHTQSGIPTLGEVRGKIVLLRRFGLSQTLQQETQSKGGFGIDATNWADNTPNYLGGDIQIQDFYQVTDTENIDKKIQYVCDHYERAGAAVHPIGTPSIATEGPKQPLFINFLSASNFWKLGCWPDKIAAKMNPAITQFLCEKHDIGDKGVDAPGQEATGDGGLGVVVCDWVGENEDWDLVRAIVGMNSRLLLRLQLQAAVDGENGDSNGAVVRTRGRAGRGRGRRVRGH